MQRRSVWRETLSREITESVSRCNLSAQRRLRELLKDAGASVSGCGLGWGIKGNFFPHFVETVPLCFHSKGTAVLEEVVGVFVRFLSL